MKRYSVGYLALLAFLVCVGLINAQEQVKTKARPNDPALPYVVTLNQPEKGGGFTVTLSGGSGLTSGQTVYNGQTVTIKATVLDGYALKEGYPKVTKTGTPSTTVSLTKVDATTYTFVMPSHPVTIEGQVSPATYTIHYVLNNDNATNSAGNPTSYTIESEAITLKAPTQTVGPGFAAWYTDISLKDEYKVTLNSIAIPKGSTGDKTFYARWIDWSYKRESISYTINGQTTQIPDSGGEEASVYNVTLDKTLEEDVYISVDATLPDGSRAEVIQSEGKLNKGKLVLKVGVKNEAGITRYSNINFTKLRRIYATFTQPTVGGGFTLTTGEDPKEEITSGSFAYERTPVTLTCNPTTGYRVAAGYPKVMRTDDGLTNGTIVESAVTLTNEGNNYTFSMPPANAITVEVQYKANDNDTRLSSLSYQVGETTDAKPLPVSSFMGGTECDVTLPEGTTGTVSLTGVAAGEGAKVETASTVLTDGKGTATVTVTAANGDKKVYKVRFTVAEAKTCIVWIDSDIKGSSALVREVNPETYEIGPIIPSGTAVPVGTVLKIDAIPLEGYNVSNPTVNGKGINGDLYTIAENDDEILVSLEQPTMSNTYQTVKGTPILTEDPAPDVPLAEPVIRVDDENSLPPDVNYSNTRLIVKDSDNENEEKLITKEAEKELEKLALEGAEVKSITLVKITTTLDGKTGEEKLSDMTPIQPVSPLTLLIPYPEGKGQDSQVDYYVVHSRSNGTFRIYSTRDGSLTRKPQYLQLTVESFSPFTIGYKAKSSTPDPDPDPDPTPNPDPDPSGYILVIPEVTGATTYPAAGPYYVTEGNRFEFTLTLDKEYDQSTPVVTIRQDDKDSTLVATILSDGRLRYEIKQVGPGMEILITGVRSNLDPPVGNAEIAISGVSAFVADGLLCIRTPAPAEVCVYDFGGTLLRHFYAPAGESRTASPIGPIVVVVGEKRFKIR